jgi:hypothetical protein
MKMDRVWFGLGLEAGKREKLLKEEWFGSYKIFKGALQPYGLD